MQDTEAVDRIRIRVVPGEEGTCRGKDGARHIKKSGRVLCEGVAARYAMIDDMRLNYPIPFLCRIFEVSSSGYYARLGRPLSQRAQEEQRLEVEILCLS